MLTRKLGSDGPEVSAIGLGTMAMSSAYGPVDRDECLATVRVALDSGVSLIDTADFYGMGANELLIAEAVRDRRREDFAISLKFGSLRGPDGRPVGTDGRPEAVKAFLAYSLTRLGTDYVDFYRPARLDPGVPIEETVGAIGELVEAGHVRHVGLSELGAETIRRAADTHPIADLQIEYSLISREIEDEILPTCRELQIGITAYGVLSRGLISGHFSRDRELAPGDFRSFSPRFSEANLEHNLELVDALQAVAERRHATVAQLAIAWVLARGADIVPLVGAKTRERLVEALGALEVELTEEDLDDIERLVPPGAATGERYPALGMAELDSER